MGIGEGLAAESKELSEFLDKLENDLPTEYKKDFLLRPSLFGGKWTDIITRPQGECNDCWTIGNDRKLQRRVVTVYDLLDLLNLPSSEEIKGYLPNYFITGCLNHIEETISKWRKGKFEYHECGPDSLHVYPKDHMLVHVGHDGGLSRVLLPEVVNASLEAEADYLIKNFAAIKNGNYRNPV